MDVEIIECLSELAPLEAEWDELNRHAADATPFSSPAWITSWIRCYGGDDPRLRIVTVRDRGRLVGVAPFYLARTCSLKVLHLLGKKHLFGGESVNLLLAPEVQEAVASRIFDALLDEVGRWDALFLYGTRYQSATQRLLFSAGQRLLEETTTITALLGLVPVVRLAGSWEEFLATRSKKFRTNSRRRHAACSQQGVSLVSESGLGDGDSLLQRLVGVEKRSWQAVRGRPTISSNRAFFGGLLPGLVAEGRADVIWAVKEGQPLAFYLYLLNGRRAYSYVTGFDPAYSELSVGSLVTDQLIRQLCEAGMQMLDLGISRWIGYKERLTREYEIALRHVLIRKGLTGRLVGVGLCLKSFP